MVVAREWLVTLQVVRIDGALFIVQCGDDPNVPSDQDACGVHHDLGFNCAFLTGAFSSVPLRGWRGGLERAMAQPVPPQGLGWPSDLLHLQHVKCACSSEGFVPG